MRTLILPSPLLGTATYRPLADALGGQVAEIRGQTLESVLAGFSDAAAGADLLVPHSNAGRFAAAMAGATGADVVYVDALLPATDPDPGFVALLVKLANDGTLPGWTDWWPTEEMDKLLGPLRTTVEAEQGQWPLEFLLTDPPAPTGWTAGPAAYLSFGFTYAAEAARAGSWGWPTRRIEGHHLQHLMDPGGVAREIVELAGKLPR